MKENAEYLTDNAVNCLLPLECDPLFIYVFLKSL